jgi:mRNA interferase RelE/StbE
MKIVISPKAKKDFKKLTKIYQISIAKKIKTLNNAPTSITSLQGFKDFYRARVGDYRIVYKKSEQEIYIVSIGHRSDVYKLLK